MPAHSQAVYLSVLRKISCDYKYDKKDVPSMYRRRWKSYRKQYENDESKKAARQVLRSMIQYDQ